jgi:hypothetical protein
MKIGDSHATIHLCRPLEYIPFLSKVIEKIFENGIICHMDLPENTTGNLHTYRKIDLWQTTFLTMLNELFLAEVLLYLILTFDIVDHELLIQCHKCGVYDFTYK